MANSESLPPPFFRDKQALLLLRGIILAWEARVVPKALIESMQKSTVY